MKAEDRPQPQQRGEPVHELLQRNLPQVYRLARHMLADAHLAEDVAQEAMLRAWRHRGRLRDVNAGRVWLLRITANLCRDELRRRRHQVSQAKSLLNDEPTGRERSVEHQAETNEQLQQVRAMMSKLPRRCRDVLYLHAFEQLDHEQIASVLGTTQRSVAVSLSRARQKIRQMIDEQPT